MPISTPATGSTGWHTAVNSVIARINNLENVSNTADSAKPVSAAQQAAINAAALSGAAGLEQPEDNGMLGWSMDPARITGGTSIGTGIVYLVRVKSRAAVQVSNLVVNVYTAGTSLANCYAGLYDASGNRLGLSANQATPWASAGFKTVALSASVNITAGVFYVGLLVGSGSAIQFGRAGASTAINGILAAPNLRVAASGSGLSALPASITLSGTSAPSNPAEYFVGIK